MKLFFCGDVNEVTDGLDIVKERLSISIENGGIKVNVKAHNNCLEIKGKGGEYFISYSKKAEFFLHFT